jgi:drug/metabolite transporter (DMT)-like permease
MTIASIVILPAMFLTDQNWQLSIISAEFLSLVLLGIFPTAMATIIYFAVISRVGPSFLSQINYLIPVWAVIIGILFLNESVDINAIIALILILIGIAIAQRKDFSFARF